MCAFSALNLSAYGPLAPLRCHLVECHSLWDSIDLKTTWRSSTVQLTVTEHDAYRLRDTRPSASDVKPLRVRECAMSVSTSIETVDCFSRNTVS